MKYPTRRPLVPWPLPFLLLALGLPALALLARGDPAWAADPDAELGADLRGILAARPVSQWTVAVAVARLGDAEADDQVLFAHNATAGLIPASNMKLVTTAAAIEHLGPEFRFRTLLLSRGEDLILVGDGDPTFGDADLLRKVGWDITTVFENWAAELKKAGLVRFRNVLVDDSVFDAVFTHPSWDPKQLLNHYSAGVAGMTLNAGKIELRLWQRDGRVAFATVPSTRYVTVRNACVPGRRNAVVVDRPAGSNVLSLRGTCPAGDGATFSVTIHDPALYAATVFRETLAAGGITVAGKVARVTAPVRSRASTPEAGYRLLAVHETPLPRALDRTNKDSVNPYAEALCKRVGFAASGQGTWKAGTAAAEAMLRRLGADVRPIVLADGSGLARGNRLTADALLRVLRHQHHAAHAALFFNSLAVGGEDGTLDDRFRDDLRGRVHAKSGYIAGVSALSGYLRSRDGRTYAFVILMNGVTTSNREAKEVQEAIVRAIDGHARRRQKDEG